MIQKDLGLIPVIPVPERYLHIVEINSVQKARGQASFVLSNTTTTSKERQECCKLAKDVFVRELDRWPVQVEGEEREVRVRALNFMIDAYQDFMQGKWQLP